MVKNIYSDKTLGIQQPFFFPYLEYFALIAATDYWIVFDTPQFVNRAWVNRNRILNPGNGSTYITVPVHKHRLNTPTNEIRIHTGISWKTRIIAQLGIYKKYAPNYSEVIDFIKAVLNPNFEYLSDLNVHALKETCSYLGVDFRHEIFSKMNLEMEAVHGPDEWGLNICKAMGVKKTVNAFTGQKFINRNKYSDNGVELKFFKFEFEPYDQRVKDFEPALSVIDAMMFNSPSEIRRMLSNFQLV